MGGSCLASVWKEWGLKGAGWWFDRRDNKISVAAFCEDNKVINAVSDLLTKNHYCVSALQMPLTHYLDGLMMMKKSWWMGGLLHTIVKFNICRVSGESLFFLEDIIFQYFSYYH